MGKAMVSLQELDEYILKYGYNDTTGIDDMRVAMFVNKKRKDKENDIYRNSKSK